MNREIDALVRGPIAAAMVGWERRGHCFLRETDAGVQTLAIQRVGAPTAVKASFAINIAVHRPEIAAMHELAFDPYASRDVVPFAIRLSTLTGRDVYTITRDSTPPAREDIATYALPYFDRTRTLEGFLDESRRLGHPGAITWVALELALGRVEDARATFRERFPDRDDVKRRAELVFGIQL